MRSFFIDLENVRSYGLEGILLLKPDDKVYVFYSDNANTLTIPTIESLNESSAQVKYIKTNYIGANAMDFQIVTLLGASIEKEKTGRFYIISHDNGFKSAVKFCEGYFTGYDIVTGVFANILLAINSEKKLSPAADTFKSNLKSEKKQAKAPEERESDRKAGKSDSGSGSKKKNRLTDDGKEQHADIGKINKSENISENISEEDKINVNPIQNDDNPSKESHGKRRSRNRRRKGSSNSEAATEAVAVSVPEGMADKEKDALDAGTALNKTEATPNENGTEKTDTRSRSRSRKGRGRAKDKAENLSELALDASLAAAEDKDTLTPVEIQDGFELIQTSSEQRDKGDRKGKKVNKKDNKRENQRNRHNNDKMSNADNKTKDDARKDLKDISKSSNYRYVYNALSDFLSKSTIDMYAASIDEGIRKSANKNELHQFFKNHYGTDEAEALYKIIYSDFDKMKREAKD